MGTPGAWLPTYALGQARAPSGADFPCPGWEPGPRPHVWTPGAWAACPFAGSDPPPRGVGTACLVPRAKGQTRRGARAKIIMFFSINTFNDNKHNNLCTPNNNIFDINSLNYKKMNIITFNYNKNKNIYTANNNIFYINDLNYNRNSNIYNTNNST
jgi:hypothetical protein